MSATEKRYRLEYRSAGTEKTVPFGVETLSAQEIDNLLVVRLPGGASSRGVRESAHQLAVATHRMVFFVDTDMDLFAVEIGDEA